MSRLQSAWRESASAGAHLEGSLRRAGGLVRCILGCFDGTEDVLIGGGSIHGTAYQLIPTGVPLDPRKRHRTGLQRPPCLRLSPLTSPIHLTDGDLGLQALQLCPKDAAGNQAPAAGRARTWALGAALHPGLETPLPLRGLPTRLQRPLQLDPPGRPLTPPAASPAPVKTVHASLPRPPGMLYWMIWKVLSLCHLVRVLLHLK